MILIIAGSRNLKVTIEDLDSYITNDFVINPSSIISGGATGIDTCANKYANYKKIAFIPFPADWKKHGKAAGPIRNKLMAEHGDVLLLIWDGKSKGSASMKKEMEKLNKPIYEVIIKV